MLQRSTANNPIAVTFVTQKYDSSKVYKMTNVSFWPSQ